MIKEHPKIEALLSYYSDKLDKDLSPYKNHVYRVFNYAVKFDPWKENEEKYLVAAVFHDLGIWTHHTLNYLNPSKNLASNYLTENKLEGLIDEVLMMIEMHHKRSRYEGEHSMTVENFRRADWIDVSSGRIRFRMDKLFIKQVQEQFPNLGFHKEIIGLTIKHALLHPLNPLPMFRR